MAKNVPLARHLQTILEPGLFEKGIIRDLLGDIRKIGSTAIGLGANIQQFAAEIGFDFFSLLLSSPHEGVQLIGQTQRDISCNLAGTLLNQINMGIHAYIDELGSAVRPIDRKRIVMEFMATKQDLGKNLSTFEALPDNAKAGMHLEKITELFRSFVQVDVMTATKGVDVNHAINNPDMNRIYDAFINTGKIPYPINICPTIIGIAYVHASVEEAIIKQMLKLDGLKGDALDAALEKVRAGLRSGFSGPGIPSKELQLMRARHQFDALMPGKNPN